MRARARANCAPRPPAPVTAGAVGLIGLGHMGGAMARRLLGAPFPLVVYDVDVRARNELSALGATAAMGIREVGDRAEVVILSLPSPAASVEVAYQLNGGRLLKVLVETSTAGPAAVRAMAEMMGRQGVTVLDAPVSGGPTGAKDGTLALMHSGDVHSLSTAMPYLRRLASRLIDVGPEPGAAQISKLVNNAISAAGMVAACEAMVVGVKAGLDAETLLAAVNASSGRNSATADKFPKAILPGTFDYGGPLGLMLKDLALFIEQAQASGASSFVASSVRRVWEDAVRRTGAETDYSMLIRPFEEDAGVEVRARQSRRSEY